MTQSYEKSCCSPLAVGNTAALREALEVIVRDAIAAEEELGSEYGADTDPWGYIADMKDTARLAIAAKPRACDLMSEEDLTKVATNGIVSSVLEMPELKYIGEGIRKLIGAIVMAAVASAIKCAYDTQHVSKKEEEQAAKSEASPETPPRLDVCPKCGADAAVFVHPAFDGGSYVRCYECRYSDQAVTWAPTDAEAAKKWNKMERNKK